MEQYWFKHIIYCLGCDRLEYCTVDDLKACIKLSELTKRERDSN